MDGCEPGEDVVYAAAAVMAWLFAVALLFRVSPALGVALLSLTAALLVAALALIECYC